MLNLPCSCNNKDISKSLLALPEVLLISIHFCTCIFNCLSLVLMVVKDFNLVSEVELVLGWLRLRLWIYGKLKQRYIKSTENSSPAFTNFFSLIFLDELDENTKQFHQLCKRAIRFITCIMQANTSPGVSCFGANVEKRRDWGRSVSINTQWFNSLNTLFHNWKLHNRWYNQNDDNPKYCHFERLSYAFFLQQLCIRDHNVIIITYKKLQFQGDEILYCVESMDFNFNSMDFNFNFISRGGDTILSREHGLWNRDRRHTGLLSGEKMAIVAVFWVLSFRVCSLFSSF